MALGNSQVVKLIETYKSQKDSAIFKPILAAGAAALSGDQSWVAERNSVYKKRRDLVLEGLRKAGFEVDAPQAALYIWTRIPTEESSMDFCARMLEEINVSTTPGVVFGEHGEGYLRISLVTTAEQLQKAVDRVIDWMKVTA